MDSTTQAPCRKAFLHLPTSLAATLRRRCAMYDNTPREVEEVIDHCRALIYAIITLESPEVKEILNFVLQQQIDLLHQTYHQATSEPLEAE